MEEKLEMISFLTEDGEEIEFVVIAQTKVNGSQYLLVNEPGTDDAYIMKQIQDTSDEITYEMVEDEQELTAVSGLFDEILEDIDLE